MAGRDYILREIEKVAAVIAKLAGLKESGKEDELIKLADSTLLNEYNINLDDLPKLSTTDFITTLEKCNYSADKLDTLAQLLYLRIEYLGGTNEATSILEKVIKIFDLLETKYHRQSFDNIHKRNIIATFLSRHHE